MYPFPRKLSEPMWHYNLGGIKHSSSSVYCSSCKIRIQIVYAPSRNFLVEAATKILVGKQTVLS